jgi:hypothetical protein
MSDKGFVTEIGSAPADMSQATALELWRKVERAIAFYFARSGQERPASDAAVDRVLASASDVGPRIASELGVLRLQYQQLSARASLIPAQEAQQYAVRVFAVMRALTSPGRDAV